MRPWHRKESRTWPLLWLALAGASGSSGGTLSGPLTPPSNGSWSQPQWFIDPAGIRGGNDSNPGTTAARPLRTYRRLAQLWGTTKPLLPQLTTITFLSSHTDNSDPVIIEPRAEGFSVVVQGLLNSFTLVTTVTLSNVTGKTRGNPGQLLQANLGASAANGLFLVNLTHPSHAIVNQNVSGNIWSISQPCQALSLPPLEPTPVDTWANGDTVQIYQLTQVNVVIADERPTEYDVAADNRLYFFNMTVFDPQGVGADVCYLRSAEVCFVESTSQRTLILDYGAPSDGGSVVFFNCAFLAGAQGPGLQVGGRIALSYIGFFAGIFQVSALNDVVAICSWDFDKDAIITVPSSPTDISMTSCIFGTVYLGTGLIALMLGNSSMEVGDSPVWGPGIINAVDRFIYDSGNTAANQFQNGGLQISGQSTAFSITAAGAINGGITITAAHLDAAAGAAGFGGRAFIPGGGCINNQG